MNEHEFLQRLEQRANEQERLMQQTSHSKTFFTIIGWFGNHPWRIMIPFSMLVSLLLRITLGKTFWDITLKIFGG